ncbi:class I adenylate-forming enzyme family protein [Nocardioides jensenii]|uniref:class I adenylate-forming enzyme family protein n=1 Tax=Nocardioides jensenii TaxID=1843 RepID=UPI00082C5F5C|nr:class I adenylate-forming enzyme family protein [Nocardioides jensenii]
MRASVADRRAGLEQHFAPWQERRLEQVLDHVVERMPNRPFVVTDDRTWSYADIQDWSRQIARGLVAAGVRPGDRVGLVMGNFPEFVAVKYAIARAGATTVPINFLNRRDELGYVLRQSGTSVLVTMDSFRGLDYLDYLDELEPGWEGGAGRHLGDLRRVFVFATGQARRDGADYLEDLIELGRGTALPETMPGPEQPSDILYTSGTTGSPKGVLLTHDMLTRTAYGSAYSRAFADGQRVTFSLPMYHVYGYVEGMLAVVYAGGCIIPQLTFDAGETLRAIVEHEADDVLLIPTMTMSLIDELEARPRELPSLTTMISSGGYSPPWIWDKIREIFGQIELTTGYGMSETTATTTLTEPGGPDERLHHTNGRMRPAGAAADPEIGGQLVQYRLVDQETGADVGQGEVGELVARGLGITPGYFRKPDETEAAFRHGWFHSGDLATIDEEGFISLVGRAKDLYRCGGEQVVPKEIEDVLVGHPAVLQAHIVPLLDDRMGEVGVAWVVLRGGHTVDAEELRAWCSERLAKFKVPRHVRIIAIDEVPVTPSGRPRKFLLAKRASEELGRQV